MNIALIILSMIINIIITIIVCKIHYLMNFKKDVEAMWKHVEELMDSTEKKFDEVINKFKGKFNIQ